MLSMPGVDKEVLMEDVGVEWLIEEYLCPTIFQV